MACFIHGMTTSRKLSPEHQLGLLIRDARKSFGITQATLASLVGVEGQQGLISKWEHGLIPSSRNLAAIIHHLDLDAEQCHGLIYRASAEKPRVGVA